MMAELRIPVSLLGNALANKRIKHLRLLAAAKLLYNSRANIDQIFEELDINRKTGKRLLRIIVNEGWAGTDGEYFYPRAWRRMKYNKRGGLYLTSSETLGDAKKFEALAFSIALKRLYRRKGPRTNMGSAKLKDLSLRYTAEALGLKERRCKQLRALAQRYGFISIKRTYSILGSSQDAGQLQKHLHGPAVFVRGKHTITPKLSEITFNL